MTLLDTMARELVAGIRGEEHELDPTPAWRWIADNFIVRDGDTGKATRYVVYPWTARMLLDVFPPGGRDLPYNLLVISTVKKSGKTTTHAAILAYLAFVRAPAGSEMFVFANSLEQSVGRVFSMLAYTAEMSPVLSGRIAGDALATIIRLKNGTTVKAQAAKAANIAGANPYYSGWTELWGYIHEKERRAWDEMTPPPTVRNSIRVVDTYAGYEGESDLLNSIEDELKAGKQLYPDGYRLPAEYLEYAERMSRSNPELARYLLPDRIDGTELVYTEPLPCYVSETAGYYGYWDEGVEARRMPWQQGERGKRYYQQQEASGMLPGSFDRLHLNKRAKRGGQFVDPTRWAMLEACDPWRPGDRRPVVLAVDSAENGDHMALVGVRLNEGVLEECYCQVWEPRPDPRYKGKPVIVPSDALVEMERLRDAGMLIAAVAYDPYQFHDVALRAEGEGFNMVRFSQGNPRLLADALLRQLILAGTMRHTHNPALKLAVESADAHEKPGPAGDGKLIRIVKGSGKVDPLVALSMAGWTATNGEASASPFEGIEGYGASGMIASAPMTGYQEDMPEREIDDLADEWGDTGGMFIGGGE